MKTTTKSLRKSGGAALILVIVVTVLLSVIGVMFLMTSRLSEMETSAVANSRDLEAGVQAVVEQIDRVLVSDFDDPTDYSVQWLASLEPNYMGVDTDSDPLYTWAHVTDLWGEIESLEQSTDYDWVEADDTDEEVTVENVPVKIVTVNDSMGIADDSSGSDETLPYGARADADGDGVADSRWVRIENLTSSRGDDVYAAVRIIDNCAMLNLNTACNFYAESDGDWDTDDWKYTETGDQYNPTGRILSEVNYRFFLRGDDRDTANVRAIMDARDPQEQLTTPREIHDDWIMHLEEVSSDFLPFDLSDELEIRNRFLLTGLTRARFEQETIAYETFDYGRGFFTGGWNTPLRVKRTPCEDSDDLGYWQWRVDPAYSDGMSGGSDSTDGDYYDRRHLCTFYSYDRNLRRGTYPLLNSEIEAYADATYATAGYDDADTYKDYLWDLWEPVFAGKEAVTTNIADYTETYPYNNVETRRRILHLLYALRDYYYQQYAGTIGNRDERKTQAAQKAVQVVANMIDFSDDITDATGYQGPFYDSQYGSQIDEDSTFITRDMVRDLLVEVSEDVLGTGNDIDMDTMTDFDFGLESSDIVYGYERQPFITEVYCQWDGGQTNPLQIFAIELVNPYDSIIYLDDYSLQIASQASSYSLAGETIPAYDIVDESPGRLILHKNLVTGDPDTGDNVEYFSISAFPDTITQTDDNSIRLLKSTPSDGGTVELIVDEIADEDFDDSSGSTIFKDGDWRVSRDDADWKFAQAEYSGVTESSTKTIGEFKDAITNIEGFQLGCPDDTYPLARWHDLERLCLFGTTTDTSKPESVLTRRIADETGAMYYDLAGSSNSLLDYLCTMSRPDIGTLPGRININTAPAHVIAAAIPPTLATMKSGSYTALTMAQEIVDYRPYDDLSDLLSLPSFNRLASDNDNIFYTASTGLGDAQAIEDDVEERDWILSHLANKLTVRSDVFTAYILVRLGTDGPQRRMIAIFNRSNVSEDSDRPQLVALHPVPDPR